MKRLFYILCVCCLLLVAASCNKRDCNGNLDGCWQLLEWRNSDGTLLADKDSMIFYCFQLQMACFNKNSGQHYLRSSLEVFPDRFRIYDPMDYIGDRHDTIFPMSVLSVMGVPADGIFHILSIGSSRMSLTTNNGDVLQLRKY